MEINLKIKSRQVLPCFLGVMIILLGFLNFPASAQTLCIYHIDVEQADATLFVSPGGRTLLVDSGKNGIHCQKNIQMIQTYKPFML